MDVTYKFLTAEEFHSPEYVKLQNKIHGKNGHASRLKRMEHYAAMGDLRVIVAIIDGKMVGQASAYRVKAIIEGKEQPFYWGLRYFLVARIEGVWYGKTLAKRTP